MSLAVLLTTAFAKSPAWFRDGSAGVELPADGVALPLLRGPTTEYLPAVEVLVPVGGQDRPALAVVDVAGHWSRLSSATASALGVGWEFTKVDGEWIRYAVLDEVRAGELAIAGLRVEIDDEAPGFVIGVRSLPEVAVAILASEGTVRFVPARAGETLLRSVGEPIAAGQRALDGLTLQVPGALRWGEAVVDGTFHLRTDLATSRVAPSNRLPDPTLRAGARYHDVGARLGEVGLPDTWIREDEDLEDPAPDFAGALGYDVLFALDLAVAPDGRVAFRQPESVRWTDATPSSVAAAKTRYAQEEEKAKGTADATTAPKEAKVEIGFDGPKVQGVVLGAKGNPVVRDRNLDLAGTLWRAGQLDEALPHYLYASQHAGDHCGAHLLLGERRLANAGPAMVDKEMVGKLVVDPIEHAAALWDAWSALDPATRDAIALGQAAPEGTVQVWQPPRCEVAWGLLDAVERARGNTPAVDRIETGEPRDERAVAYVRALAALAQGKSAEAIALLEAADGAPVDPADLEVARALAKAGQGDLGGVLAAVREVPGHPTEHPLTAALGVLAAARRTDQADEITRKLWRADERWVPGQLVRALATGQPPPAWDEDTERRAPGSSQILCQRAVHTALAGDVARAKALLDERKWRAVADWWAANVVVARLAGDLAGADAALRELALRFPLVPPSDFGLPPPPPAPPPRRRRPG